MIASDSASTIDVIEPSAENETDLDELLIQEFESENGSEIENGTQRIDLLRSLAKKHGLLKIKSEPLNISESGMQKTEEQSSIKSDSEETGAILPVDYSDLSKIIQKELSTSTSLIDDSVKHLHKLMKSVATVQDGEQLPISQMDRVKAATSCAHQIYQLLKVKVDAVKAFKEMQ